MVRPPQLGDVRGTLPPGERPPEPVAASVWTTGKPPGEGFKRTGETIDRSLSFGDTLHEWHRQARQAKDSPSGGSGVGNLPERGASKRA